MSKITLLLLQVGVAVVSIAAWHVFSTYPVFGRMLLPPFFFSNPFDVANQVVVWFVSGVIWKHLWVTLIEAILAFAIGSIGGVLVGFWFARQPRTADQNVRCLQAVLFQHAPNAWWQLRSVRSRKRRLPLEAGEVERGGRRR